MSLESFVFSVAFATLLGTPIAAPLLSLAVARRRYETQRRILALSAAFVFLVAAAIALKLSLWATAADALVLFVAYLSVGVLAVSVFRLRPRPLGVLLGTLASLPLVAGVLLGTIGALGVLFIVGDMVPVHEGRLESGLKCYITSFGNATTATGGYDVHIKRPVPGLPLLETEVRTTRIEFYGPKSVSMEDLCLRVSRAEGGG